MKRKKPILLIILTGLLAAGLIFYFTIPVKRVNILSTMIMLGDLNNDKKWDHVDQVMLDDFIKNPFAWETMLSVKVDVNRNGLIDRNDIEILSHLYKYSNPYKAEKAAFTLKMAFPRPRELFRYLPSSEYLQKPLYVLKSKIAGTSPLTCLHNYSILKMSSHYQDRLKMEIYNEAMRFTFTYARRVDTLEKIEKNYIERKITYCNSLWSQKRYYNLLLNLISIVEDAETLSVKNQSRFINSILYFRDHLRNLLASKQYKKFKRGKISYLEIFAAMEKLLQEDLGVQINFSNLKPPRELLKLQNYLDRAQWQYYKSTAKRKEMFRLLLFAQYDWRYLRAVSKTSPRFEDLQLKNHNLPMILLFREALRISGGNKKEAVGMIDEAIRIPFAWIKMIPQKQLPSSIALENFLLPGNKEDGSDKSRHWNVFGGISIYKSPRESLILALRRELSDARKRNYTPESMTEFIRDTIANINGIYYVVMINPKLKFGAL